MNKVNVKNTKIKKEKQKSTNKKKPYLSYYHRLLLLIIITCILLFLGIIFIEKSISLSKEQKIYYTENSNLDYKVYLKENDFYESKYLGKNMSYIASLIDHINISFDYKFKIDKPVNADFKYKIIAIININNENSSSTFFSKEYTLLEEKVKSIENETSISIKEDVKIDYDFYNKLSNDFKKTYGINTASNLAVYLKINRDVDDSFIPNNGLDNSNSMLINIPLSQKAINIKMEYDEINNNDSVIANEKININNILYFSIGIILLIIAIVLTIKILIKLTLIFDKNNDYDKLIKRILKEYDRLIVITDTMPDLEKMHVFKINSFSELLDVRDNIKKPIMYYNVIDHTKCYFYLKDDNDAYLLCIKAVDMEKKEEK